MISVTHNSVLNALEVYCDSAGATLLINELQKLIDGKDHVHLHATDDDSGLSITSPYGETPVYREVVLNLLPTEAWRGDD